MKKKSNGMSPDMLHDATPSTPIRVFIINDETKNESKNPLQDVTEDLTGVGKPTPVKLQNELIKIDFDKQTVSARALYDFFELAERFSAWWTRMVSYGLTENIDYTGVNFFTSVGYGAKQDIGDYLLTIDAAKHIAMIQRCEKGKQARNYFINVEKLYLKNLYSQNPNPVTAVTAAPLLENFKNLLVQLESTLDNFEKAKLDQQQAQSKLVEKMVVLEKQLEQHNILQKLKEQYIERSVIQKVDKAFKDTFTEADKMVAGDEMVERLSRISNFNNTISDNDKRKDSEKEMTLEEELVRQYYKPAYRKMEGALFLTATEITLRLEKFNKRVTVQHVGRALKKGGFERVPHSKKGGKMKGYFVIQLF